MKHITAILLCLVLAASVLPTVAEDSSSTAEKWADLLNAFGNLFESLSEDASEWAGSAWDEIQEAAGSASEWTQTHYDDLKEAAAEFADGTQSALESAMSWIESNWESLTNEFSEGADDLKARLNDIWDSVSKDAGEFYQNAADKWSSLKGNTALYTKLLSIGSKVLIHESMLETVSLIEDTAAEKQAEIPDDVRAVLDEMKQFAVEQTNMDEKIQDQALTDFMKEIGLDEEAFENQLSERFKLRIRRLGIEAETACLNEYMAENSLTFTSAARRAQDRLTRYAAGTLDLTDEQFDQAVKIIDKWAKEAGIDEAALVQKILEYMENKQ